MSLCIWWTYGGHDTLLHDMGYMIFWCLLLLPGTPHCSLSHMPFHITMINDTLYVCESFTRIGFTFCDGVCCTWPQPFVQSNPKQDYTKEILHNATAFIRGRKIETKDRAATATNPTLLAHQRWELVRDLVRTMQNGKRD